MQSHACSGACRRCASAAATRPAGGRIRTWSQSALTLLLLLLALVWQSHNPAALSVEARSIRTAGPPGSGDPGPPPPRQIMPHERVPLVANHKGMGAIAAARQQEKQQQQQQVDATDRVVSDSEPLGWDLGSVGDWAGQSFRSLSTAMQELASRPLAPAPVRGPKHDLEGSISFDRESGRERSPGAAPPPKVPGSAAAASSVSSTSSASSSSGTDSGSSGSSTPIPVRRTSRAAGPPSAHPFGPPIIDNIPPALMPSARLVAPLSSLEDGTHWAVTMQLGGDVAAGLPSSSSLPVRLLVDTGMSDAVLFNKSGCVPKYSMNLDPVCANNVRSPSFSTDGVEQGNVDFRVVIDGELFQFFRSSINVGIDLLTWTTALDGTTQNEYLIGTPHLIVSNGDPIDGRPANSWNFDAADLTTFALVNQNYFDRADGVLGVAWKDFSSMVREYPAAMQRTVFASMLQDVTGDGDAGGESAPSEPIFGLDFRGGRMDLGGINELYRDRLSWSDGPSPLLRGYHSLHVYHLKICGVDMFQNLTSSWHALVDSGSSCLGLPAEFFDMVISWIPLRCNLGRYDSLPNVCYLTDDVRPVLPTLSFRLADNGRELFIDLSKLLFPQKHINRICLYRLSSVRNAAGGSNPIVFGSRVLEQFYAVFDMNAPSRVGLANKDEGAAESRVQCASRVQCSGMQVHYEPLNMCLRPPCGEYYFFAYDADTKMCKLNTGFHVLCGLLVGLFLLLELGLNEVVMRLTEKVMASGVVVGQ